MDTLTARFLVENLFKGALLKGRTVLLVVSEVDNEAHRQTQHVDLVEPLASYIVIMHRDGTIASACATGDLTAQLSTHCKAGQPAAVLTAPGSSDNHANKLILPEEKAMGRMSRHGMIAFFA